MSLVTVIATLCLAGVGCSDKLVTESATGSECGILGQVYISRWMEREGWAAKGYKLQAWKCVYGGKRQDT